MAPLPWLRVTVLIAATLLAIVAALWLLFVAVLVSEPSECAMTLTELARAQCDQALERGDHSMLPTYALAATAALLAAATGAAWVLARRRAWVPWAALVGVPAVTLLSLILFTPDA
ncbi:hypothetical protein O4J56_00480 [Nocardiopsis sp. RSe5-2]|uniref:Uncharacterized protein n=1 Tax=Nocardiopsis endophytica TaxID=3018445 RepID=A0ABT4TXW0_9ACTN|nr:hypothetical protein [Nocardiopsis endophytica]MDA2809104.1 hypothetical protein [Nocardiopsis endophytica]